MNTQLSHLTARQRGAELHLAGELARLASELPAGQRNSVGPKAITGLSAYLTHLTARSAPTRP